MKTVLFVPGSGEDLHSRDYKAVLKEIESKGYEAKFVAIEWRRTTIDDWVGQLMIEYAKYEPSKTILAGFSWGAMTAFVAAASRVPAALWLCSLSPYFQDDTQIQQALLHQPPRHLGKRRTEAFARLPFNTLAKQITCNTLLFVGELEAAKFRDLKRRCDLAAHAITHAELISVTKAGHEVDNPNYIAALKANI